MSYELRSNTGEHMTLLHRELELLLFLAELYGWGPERGDIDHYAQGGIVSQTDAAAMSAAIKRAFPDVPAFLADGLTEEERTKPKTLEGLRNRPGNEQGDPLAYFSGHRRNMLRNFTRKIAADRFEIRLMPGFTPEF